MEAMTTSWRTRHADEDDQYEYYDDDEYGDLEDEENVETMQ